MYKKESVLEDEMLIIVWDFEVQMDHLIPARGPDLVMINKKKFAVQADHWVKIKENEKRDKYLDLARKLKSCETCE